MTVFSYTNRHGVLSSKHLFHSGRAPLGMGTAHLAFVETNTCTGQITDLSWSNVPSDERMLHS